MTDDDRPGDCIVTIVDRGSTAERLVVQQADRYVYATKELVEEWLSDDRSPHIRLNGGVVEFGTPNEGCGVVRYRIGDIPGKDDPLDWSSRGLTMVQWYRGHVLLTREDRS